MYFINFNEIKLTMKHFFSKGAKPKVTYLFFLFKTVHVLEVKVCQTQSEVDVLCEVQVL